MAMQRGQASLGSPTHLQRWEALRIINEVFPDQPIVVTLGGSVREMVAVCGRRPNHLHLLDSMGLAAPIGLGLALGLAEDPSVERVVVIEGEGSLTMGFSVFTSIGYLQAKKLLVIIPDNGVYLTTGGQPTTAQTTDLVATARACGFAAESIEGANGLRAALTDARYREGPLLLRVPVGTQAPPTEWFLEDPVILAEDFRRWLATRRSDTGGAAADGAGANP